MKLQKRGSIKVVESLCAASPNPAMAGHHQQIQRTPYTGSVEKRGLLGRHVLQTYTVIRIYVLLQADCSKQRRIQCVMHRFRELHGSIRAELVICCHLSPLH